MRNQKARIVLNNSEAATDRKQYVISVMDKPYYLKNQTHCIQLSLIFNGIC